MNPLLISPNDSSTVCLECKNYANRDLKDKIIACCRKISNSVHLLIDGTIKYRLKFFNQLLYFKDWMQSGKAIVNKYEKFECPNEEHAIIIVNFNKSTRKNNYVYGSGIEILVEYFVSKSKKFKIYNCYNTKCFEESIEKTKAQNLWIFGHGDRHGISFGDDKGDYFPFCKLEGKERRSFIAQLHCCHDTGKTLWEYLSDEPGIFLEGYRTITHNREEIKKWIERDRIN